MSNDPVLTIDTDDLSEPDEVAQVLSALDALARTTISPVIRVCLEEARADIAHLASAGDETPAAATAEAA